MEWSDSLVYTTIPKTIEQFINDIEEKSRQKNENWGKVFRNTFSNTLLTTVKILPDGTTFVLTGDIPAMWLRDSTAQVRPYLFFAKNDRSISDMIKGLVKRQFMYINIDPYANAFNETENFAGHQDDHTEMNGFIWERKFEIDSLCYPVQLAYLLYKNTGRTDQFDEVFTTGIEKILTVFETEQDHEHSPYVFERDTERLKDTLTNGGKGAPVKPNGLIWSGFRPSDDACDYGYLIPSNMFAVVVLKYITEIFTTIRDDQDIVGRAEKLIHDVKEGIKHHAIVKNAAGEEVYAFEIDGFGNSKIMDDGNVPNLMSAPYLGFCDRDERIYQNTRKTVLSPENPYFYSGKYASGIGSSHTDENFVWPITLAMQGLTDTSKEEKERLLNLLVSIDADTDMMHESINVDDPTDYTRPWFSWSNMMFCELVMDYFGYQVKV